MAYRRVVTRVGSLPGPAAVRSGVEVSYSYRDGVVGLSGWYDSFVGIEPVQISLAEFLQALGITLDDCRAALAVPPAHGRSTTTTMRRQGA